MVDAQVVAKTTTVVSNSRTMVDHPSAANAVIETTATALPAQYSLRERISRAAFDVNDSDDLRLRKTLLIFASMMMAFAAVLWLGIYRLMGISLTSNFPLLYLLSTLAILGIYLKTKNFDFYRIAQLSLFLFAPFIVQWSIGSFVSSSGVVLLALLAPVGAMVVYGPRESIPWFVAYVVLTALSGFFDYFLASGDEAGVPMRTVAVFFVLNFTILSSIVYLLLRYFVEQKDVFQAELSRQHNLVRAEQQKADLLLTTILPTHIAQRLKQEQTTIADGFADVSVMFADIVNFTGLTEDLTPKEVVNFLDGVFTRFDELAEKHGVDKIKTIGDAYMVAGGLSGDGTQYVDAVVDMALEMLELTRNDELMKRYDIRFHVGIATGPVIAGVIGAKRFIYDLWGDTVNIASRITSEAQSNRIPVYCAPSGGKSTICCLTA